MEDAVREQPPELERQRPAAFAGLPTRAGWRWKNAACWENKGWSAIHFRVKEWTAMATLPPELDELSRRFDSLRGAL